MKYVCLVHFPPEAVESLEPEALRSLQAESVAYDEELARGGHLLTAHALQNPGTAVLVKVRSGKVSTTDGPYADTKEHLGGFILLEARDLNDALRLAAGIPMARLGTIEVRPIYEFEASAGA